MAKTNKSEETRDSEQKTFSSELGGGEFYPDLPRLEFKEILDKSVLVLDCQLIEEFKSKFGIHDALLILIENPDGQFTTITSGEVIIKRIQKAKREGLLPLFGTVSMVKDSYYNIL